MLDDPDLNETFVRVSESSICFDPRWTLAVHRAPPAKVTHAEVSAEVGYLLQQTNLVRHFTPDWQSLRTCNRRTQFSTCVLWDFLKSRMGVVTDSSPLGALR
jgi:hypothetical protein